MKQEATTKVNPIPIGSSKAQSWYLLLPIKLREKRDFKLKTTFAIIESENGDIIYRKQET